MFKVQSSSLKVQRIKNFKQPVCLVATLLSITLLGSSFRSGKTDANELPGSIRMAADSLNKYSIFSETYTLDPELRQSQENNYADWLRRHATPDQLAEIAKTSTSHNIRLWALRILLENPDKQVFDVLKEAVNDTTKDEQMSYRFLSNTPYNHRAFFTILTKRIVRRQKCRRQLIVWHSSII